MMETNLENEIQSLQLANAEKDLSRDEQLKVIAQLLGYKTMPVDITTFLDDPYYMGSVSKNLYPFWREILVKIFPTPIHTATPILVFTGAIGTGKSTAVRFMAEYMKHRIGCLKNPYDTFQLVPGKNLKFSFFHKTSTLAQTDFLDVIYEWEELSPYFKEMNTQGKFDIIEQVGDSVRTNTGIGSDVLFYNLSELNFIPFESAHYKLDQALKRWSSRFDRFINYFGMVIIDTSSQGDDSIADDFIANNPYGDKVLAIHTCKWGVRKHLNYYGNKGWFQVYTGDSIYQPFIVKPEVGKVITSDMDPDRVIQVPEECRSDFEFDLITALQDQAGISVTMTDKFFPDTSNLLKAFQLPQYGPDVVKFDFYDKSDKLIYRFQKTIDSIPKDKIIFIRFDIGVVSDNTGVAIGYFDGWVTYDKDKKVRQPRIVVPLAVGINRFEGQETPIYQLFEFIMDLNEMFEIGCITVDQFASRQLLQQCSVEGITNQYLSVDRTDEAYVYMKSLANSGLLILPKNELLRKECCELRRVGNKIDHPIIWSPELSKNITEKGSKDIADAVSGVVYNIFQHIDKAGLISTKYNVNTYSNDISKRLRTSKDSHFQDMLKQLY